MRRVRWALPLLSAAVMLGGACTSQPGTTASNAGGTGAVDSALPPVALPDLSPMETSVRQQMAEQHQALVAMVAEIGRAHV